MDELPLYVTNTCCNQLDNKKTTVANLFGILSYPRRREVQR